MVNRVTVFVALSEPCVTVKVILELLVTSIWYSPLLSVLAVEGAEERIVAPLTLTVIALLGTGRPLVSLSITLNLTACPETLKKSLSESIVTLAGVQIGVWSV